MILYIGINLVIFINRLIIIRIISFPIADFDINPKLSMSMDSQDHSEIDSECNYSAEELFDDFVY